VQDDPGFCSLAKVPAAAQATGVQAVPAASAPVPQVGRVSVPDPRIRAVVALAPMAVVFTADSLAAIKVPVLVIVAERDAVLNGRYHGGYVVANLPSAQARTAAGAGHFAFMAQSSIPLPSAAGDAAANPPGFDRAAYLSELEDQIAGFFAAQWR
jgi:predicted dienelactone hydrolase